MKYAKTVCWRAVERPFGGFSQAWSSGY